LVVADRIAALLSPGCERIEVAGSVRRKRPDVGDIEIVARPKMEPGQPASLFAEPPMVSALDSTLALVIAAGILAPHPERPANGERYKRLWVPASGLQLDLFLVRPPAEWGPIFTIRTGPADYSQRLVTALRRKGWRCEEGRVLDNENERVPCPEERDFLAACGEPWSEPETRK
jgi:DNA polymerase/3'-5' exonuclease PolX